MQKRSPKSIIIVVCFALCGLLLACIVSSFVLASKNNQLSCEKENNKTLAENLESASEKYDKTFSSDGSFSEEYVENYYRSEGYGDDTKSHYSTTID